MTITLNKFCLPSISLFKKKPITIDPAILARVEATQWTINNNLFNINKNFLDTYTNTRGRQDIKKLTEILDGNKGLAENYATQLAYEQACKKLNIQFDMQA